MLRSLFSSNYPQSFIFNSTMSSSRFNARGRGRWGRGFCHRPPWDGGGGHPFVSGDSHLDAVRDANYGCRQGHGGDFSNSWGNPGQDLQPRQQFHPQQQQQFRPHPQGPQFHRHPQGPQFNPHPQGPQFYPHPWPQFRPHPYPQFRRHTPQNRPEDYRNWVYAVNQPPSQCERFTVLSYNILADYLARDHRSKLYFHIPQFILDWEWRKKKLFVEFGLWSPDIMCLQEVDRFHDLEEELAIRGYAAIWKMRTGNAVDGCAIFWRTNRFQLCHEEHIEFSKLGLRDNVAQICVLQSRKQNPVANSSTCSHDSSGLSSGVNQVVICNIHVLYNPRRGELKLGQVRSLLDRAYAVSRTWNDAPVIVCGDFNSTPKSPMYKFISEQKLNLSGLARNQISGQYADSIHASWPHVGSGYRPQLSRGNHTGPKDVELGNKFKASDSHHKPHNDTVNSSQNEMLPSPDMLNGVSSGKLLSDSNELSDCTANETEEVGTGGSSLGDDTLCMSRLIDPSHRQDERYEGCSEDHFKLKNCWNQDVTSAGSSKNEHYSGEFQLEHGKNSSTTQPALFIRSSLSGSPQLNECVRDDLVRHGMDSTVDSELCQELKDLYRREKDAGEFDPEIYVAPTTHEASTDHDTLKVDMNAIHDPLVEASQFDASPEKHLFDEGFLDRNPMNNFGISLSSLDMSLGIPPANYEVSKVDPSSVATTKEKVGTASSFQDTCTTNQPSTYSSSLNEVDRIRVEDLLLDGDCLHTDSSKIRAYTEENITLDITNHNTYIDLNSEESNQLREKSVLASGSYREPLEDHYSSQVDGLINETCSSRENSDPNFFKELIGTEDADDYMELYGEKKILLSPVHTSGNAETNGNTSDPTFEHNTHLGSPTDRIQDDSPHPVVSPPANMEYSYNPYLWTPMEVEAASGNAECSLVEHRLKLRSAYTDVEDCAGTKDASREPEVTSYHRLFMGTVDYIWYSEGLQTVKVLDTIPKHVLRRTPGFPTRKWGSDHLALACEVAFTKGVETTK